MIPDIKTRVYKSCIVREWNDSVGRKRLSSDRVIRYRNSVRRDSSQVQQAAFERSNYAYESHALNLFDHDTVAILFEDNKQVRAQYGRVYRMRKNSRRSVDWVKQVDLKNRTSCSGLHIVCHYFNHKHGSDENVHVYDESWSTSIEITNVICPVTMMTFQQETNDFVLTAKHASVVNDAVIEFQTDLDAQDDN